MDNLEINGIHERKRADSLSPLAVWGLSLGCAVGWGAFMVPANLFIPTAGPLGTLLAMVISTALLLIIAINFCSLAKKYHDNGGIVSYVRHILGHDHAFLVAWVVVVAYFSILWANATATVLLVRFLFGEVLSWGYMYTIADFDIYFGEVLFTWAIILIFGLFSCYGGRLKNYLNTIFAVVFFLTVVMLFIALWGKCDISAFNPPFQQDNSLFMQVFSMVMLAPWMFFGFEAVTHTRKNFNFSIDKLFPITIAAILAGGIIYVLLAAMAVMAIPPEFSTWTSYIEQKDRLTGLARLPVFHSVYSVFGTDGLIVLCISISTAIMTSLLGLYRTTGHLLQFMGRSRLLPVWFTKRAEDETPRNAILFAMLVSLLIPLLGRVSIVWLCDVITIVGSVAYGYVSVCSYIVARQENNHLGEILGIFGVAISCLFFFCPLIPGVLVNGSLTTESYLMLAVWSLLAFAYYWYLFRSDTHNSFGHSTTMCIILLFINFFATSVWLQQSMEKQMLLLASGTENINYSDFAITSTVQMTMIVVILLLMANIFITLKRRERKLNKIRRDQHKTIQNRNTFLMNLAHDIRIPMETAQNSIHQALENCTICTVCSEESCPRRIPDRLINQLGILDNHSQYLISMIERMLDKNIIEVENHDFYSSDINPFRIYDSVMNWRHVLQRIKDLFDIQMRDKNIFFNAYATELPHPLVHCDEQQIERLLINLVNNASEYTFFNGGTMVILTEIGLTTSQYKDHDVTSGIYELHISDTGPNLSPDVIHYLENKPFELKPAETNGLYIVKGLLQLLGGTIKVNSLAESGTGKEIVITLTLPLADDDTTNPT